MSQPKLLAFSGSARSSSFNQRLVAVAAEAARTAGADVTLISLKDYPLPLFDQDLESRDGPPFKARKLKELMMAADGFLIATPEYNSTLTPALKNAIDWVSREGPGEPTLVAFKGKKAGLLSASPSQYGGARSLKQLRELLGNIRVEVVEQDFSLAKANEAFKDDGSLKDAEAAKEAAAVAEALVTAFN